MERPISKETDLDFAPLARRFAASLFDYALVGLVSVVLSLVFATIWYVGSPDDGNANAAAVGMSIGMGVGAWIALLYTWLGNASGGTLGKTILGLEVVHYSEGRKLGLVNGLVRAVVWLLGGALLIGWLAAIWDTKNRAWHDLAADSVVVRKRLPGT